MVFETVLTKYFSIWIMAKAFHFLHLNHFSILCQLPAKCQPLFVQIIKLKMFLGFEIKYVQ